MKIKAKSILKLRAIAIPLFFFFLNGDTATELRCIKPKYSNCMMIYKSMSLWCDHTNLTTIPTPENLIGKFHAPPEKSFTLIFRNSCVERIGQNTLGQYPWAVVLDLSENFIKVLQVNAFPNLERLKHLYLSNNRLSRIDDNIFKSLNNLQDLRLDHNDIESISELAFSGLSHLVNLTLSNNKLRILPEEVFRNVPQLKMLDLRGNQFTAFRPEYLVFLSNLKSLNLAENRLKSYDSHIYLAANNISKLYLNNNSIDCFAADAFDKQGISVIEIANNPLKRPNRQWFSRFIEENNLSSEKDSIVMSKINSWICDCKVYSYLVFLQSLSPKWQEKLDIECSEPYNLRGKMLSQLDWKSLSHHGKCTVPDDYDPCPNHNSLPNFPSTRTTYLSTTTFAEVSPPEIQTERPNPIKVSQSDTDKHDFLLSYENKDGSVSESKVYFVIAATVIVFAITLVGIGYCLFFYLRNQTKKEQLDFTIPAESSRTDPLLDCFDSSQLGRPSSFELRNAHFATQNELKSDNFNACLQKPINPVPSSALSCSSNDSNPPYDRLNFSSIAIPAQKNLSCRQQQQMAISSSSPETSTFVRSKPTSIQITLDIPGLPGSMFQEDSNPARHNQLLVSTPAEQTPISCKPGYLNAFVSNT